MNEPTAEIEMLKQTVQKLMEHFDSIHIFASKQDEAGAGGTLTFQRGAGHWYMRHGQIHEWMITQNELARMKARLEWKEKDIGED